MAAVLGETFRLLAGHLNLFTLLSLTVWLPGHVALNYLRFFEKGEDVFARTLHVGSVIQIVLDPLVVSATLVALARIKQGLPVDYWQALSEGFAAWGRLVGLRLLINAMLWLPALGWVAMGGSAPAVMVAGGLLLIAVTGLILVLLIRCAVVDAVVVLGGANALTAWRRAAALTVGQRGPILGTMALLFALVFGAVLLAGQAFRIVPALHHFVVRVLVDCALAVTQSLFTIALFLFYWRAVPAAPPLAPAA